MTYNVFGGMLNLAQLNQDMTGQMGWPNRGESRRVPVNSSQPKIVWRVDRTLWVMVCLFLRYTLR